MGTQTCGFLGNGIVTTTNNVSTILLTLTVPNDCGINATIHITGRNTSTGDCYHKIAYLSGKNISGTCSMSSGIDGGLVQATSDSGYSDISMGACSIVTTVYTNTIRISVTGLPATNIDWFASSFGVMH